MTAILPVDSTQSIPPNGWTFPLFPKGYFRGPAPNAHALLGCWDRGLNTIILGSQEYKRQHLQPYATGDNVDDLAAIIGLTRFFKDLPNQETDDQLRVRMQAFCLYGPSAQTLGGMATFLATILGVPVTTQDTYDGHFQINVLGNTPLSSQILAMARSVKSAGMRVNGYIYSSRRYIYTPVRAGDVRAGTVTAGNKAVAIPLTG